ncbi:MAG: hypothetical protein CTY20_00675 [Hyphomicrobium sp.]|nr:MAG: hypothetical protein CTY20_00675 [Hyphomicrobium sp.]
MPWQGRPKPLSERRPVLRNNAAREAFDAEFEIGRKVSLSGVWPLRLDVLQEDLAGIERCLESGDTGQALTRAADALGMSREELFSILAPGRQNGAGLLGYLHGLIAGAEPLPDRRNERIDVGYNTKRRGYGRT